jgi:hypothetical protein
MRNELSKNEKYKVRARRVAEAVRASGECSLGDIARALNRRGVRSGKKSRWSAAEVARLLYCSAPGASER